MQAADSSLRLILVDGRRLFREGLASLLSTRPGVEVLAVTADAEETVGAARQLLPDLVLIGSHLAPADCLAATRLLSRQREHVRVVLLAWAREAAFLTEAARAGACGVVSDAVDADELVRLLDAVRREEEIRSPHFMPLGNGARARHAGPRRDRLALTDQEHRVLARLVEGRTNGEIARDLGICRDTVKAHLKHIFRKLGVRSRTEAVVVGLRGGVVDGAATSSDAKAASYEQEKGGARGPTRSTRLAKDGSR